MEKKQDSQPERPSPERKPQSMGGNLVWYLLALGVGTLVVISVLGPGNQVEIPYGRLVDLIDGMEADPKASIEIDEGTRQKPKKVRYSQPADLTFGPEKITGTVTRIVNPGMKEEKSEAEVAFVTPRLGL